MTNRSIRKALLLAFTVLAVTARPSHAQTPGPPPPPPEREGTAEFAFVGTTGNSSTQAIGIGGELIFRPSPWESRTKVAYVRNESEDELKAQSFVLTTRVQRALKPRLSAYGQYGYQRDRFAGIVNRNVIDGGLSYVALEEGPHKLIVDGGFGYAHEQRVVGNNLSTATFTTGGLYTLKISSTADLSEEGRFVFSLSDGADWRYGNAFALTAKLTTLFSLKASNTLRYVHQPVQGFKTTDDITSVALVAKF
jgi:putative salt-induced outer membrane protein